MTCALADAECTLVWSLARLKALGELVAAAAAGDALVVAPDTWSAIGGVIEAEAQRGQVAAAQVLIEARKGAGDAT